jgi:hypothetical protein
MQFPQGHRKKLRTVNMLERLNKEIKRRTRVATLFPNTAYMPWQSLGCLNFWHVTRNFGSDSDVTHRIG